MRDRKTYFGCSRVGIFWFVEYNGLIADLEPEISQSSRGGRGGEGVLPSIQILGGAWRSENERRKCGGSCGGGGHDGGASGWGEGELAEGAV